MVEIFVALILVVAALGFTVAGSRRVVIWWQSGRGQDALLDLGDIVLPERRFTAREVERRLWRRIRNVGHVHVSGRTRLPTGLVLEVSNSDFSAIAGHVSGIEHELKAMLLKRAREKDWQVPASLDISLRLGTSVRNGHPRVVDLFVSTDKPSPSPMEETSADEHTRPGLDGLGGITIPVPGSAGYADTTTQDKTMRYPSAMLVCLGDRPSILLGPDLGHLTVGRDPAADVVIDGVTVSRNHAELRRVGTQWEVVDMNSLNGVKINGTRVRSRRLSEGDEVEFGSAPKYAYSITDSTQLEGSR